MMSSYEVRAPEVVGPGIADHNASDITSTCCCRNDRIRGSALIDEGTLRPQQQPLRRRRRRPPTSSVDVLACGHSRKWLATHQRPWTMTTTRQLSSALSFFLVLLTACDRHLRHCGDAGVVPPLDEHSTSPWPCDSYTNFFFLGPWMVHAFEPPRTLPSVASRRSNAIKWLTASSPRACRYRWIMITAPTTTPKLRIMTAVKAKDADTDALAVDAAAATNVRRPSDAMGMPLTSRRQLDLDVQALVDQLQRRRSTTTGLAMEEALYTVLTDVIDHARGPESVRYADELLRCLQSQTPPVGTNNDDSLVESDEVNDASSLRTTRVVKQFLRIYARNSGPQHPTTATKCCDLLDGLWSSYDAAVNTAGDGDDGARGSIRSATAYCPTYESHRLVLQALARAPPPPPPPSSSLKRNARQKQSSSESNQQCSSSSSTIISNAKRAELILDTMERRSSELQDDSLAPTTECVNLVLEAWTRSGDRLSSQRCRLIVSRMESLALHGGRTRLRPTPHTYNIVLNGIASSPTPPTLADLRHAEDLIRRMDEMAQSAPPPHSSYATLDPLPFNLLLKCWAKSKDWNAASRAEDILVHMERRYNEGATDMRPDVATYNTVLTAWTKQASARSGGGKRGGGGSHSSIALQRAEELLERMEGPSVGVKPNALSYNILIHAYAQLSTADPSSRSSTRRPSNVTAQGSTSASSSAEALVDKAVELLARMKRLHRDEGRVECRPDAYSYTGVCTALAKVATLEASKQAEALLHELEDEYRACCNGSSASGDDSCNALKPTRQLYTSVIHAIARSRSDPHRAEALVHRMNQQYDDVAAVGSGDSSLAPDVVCYDALLNAYGWSNVPGRARKCYEIFKSMLARQRNDDGRAVAAVVVPDIITCNSVLNALAFEPASTPEERSERMRMAVDVYETFQEAAPAMGWPNHVTYSHLLLCIANHMDGSDPRRHELAETTFWKCCKAGHVSVLVVTQLRRALSWDRFRNLLGADALLSTSGDDKLEFDLHKLPAPWTRFAPRPRHRQDSRPSPRAESEQITKSSLLKLARKTKKKDLRQQQQRS